MSCIRRRLPAVPDLAQLQRSFPQRWPAFLQSAARGVRAGTDLLFASDGRFIHLDSNGILDSDGFETGGGDFASALRLAWQRERADRSHAVSLPFFGGWFLYFSYEYSAWIEPRLAAVTPAPFPGQPVALALRCPAAIIVNHAEGHAELVGEAGTSALLDAIETEIASVAGHTPPQDPAQPIALIEDDPQKFIEGVSRVHEYLRAGDVFQVNLSRGWQGQARGPIDPFALYAALSRSNPAPFAGHLHWRDFDVLSSSPERLLEIRSGRIQTRPIAGTRPRAADAAGDAALSRELLAHPKERAEHVMLIDLERNDLGRVCAPGSVEVDEFMVLESYAHVHHIVSNVRGRLRAGITPDQALHALFPGGTITGCPKVRCMEIIAELEREPRGAYTGSMGYLDHSGDMDLNILIRSIWVQGDRLGFRAGSGLVVDSVAEAELAETRAKARGLLRALDFRE